MQKTKDPGLEFIKYSKNQFCKSLINPFFDPLVWNKDVGYLPGSTLKFRQNKMGLLELWEENKQDSKENSNSESPEHDELIITKTEKIDLISEIIEERKEKFDKNKNGIKSPLNTSSYGRKRKRRIIDGEVVGFAAKTRREKLERETTKSKSSSFDWTEYLKSIDGRTVPAKLFDNIGIRFSNSDMENNKTKFAVNQKLEGIDPNNESLFCVLTIVEICGSRLRLHFDGYQDQFDFWTLADSQLIFPPGWSEKNNKKLQLPKDYNNIPFTWAAYLTKTKSEAAQESCFAIVKNPISPRNNFVIGQKLEAVDKRNSGMICVATVKDIIGDNVLVHFDSWDSSYDMWAHCCSPLLLPVGYCEDNEKVLSIPSAYGHDLSSFSWESYLKLTNSISVPNSVFEERNQWWFDLEVGMRCEVIDKRCPQLIRTAHVAKLNEEFQVTIGFDDWSEKYNYKIDLGSSWTNILPVGWCAKNGCILQPPPTFDASIESSACPIYGCKGYGHVKGPRYSNHQRTSGCPYAECNLNKDFKSADRIPLSIIQSIDNSIENIPISNKPEEVLISENIKEETVISVQKPLEIEIPIDDVEPMDLSMKENKFPVQNEFVTDPSIDQNEILDDSQIPDNSPCDFHHNKIYDFPPSLSLQELKEHDENFELFKEDQKFFFQSNPPKNLIPNPVAIVSSSVLRSYTNRIPYHPSDDYRRIMEWNIVEQILPPLKTVKDENSQVIQELQNNKNLKGKSKNKKITNKKRSSNVSDHIKDMNIKKSIFQWSSYEVSHLISLVIGTDQYTKTFVEQEVDGAAFMCLKQLDLMKVLGMKLGPAIKVSSGIQYLRQLFPETKLSEIA